MTQRVVCERELETRGPVVRQVVFDERDDGTPRAVVEQRVVVEDHDGVGFEIVAEVLDQTGDRSARVGESGERDDQREPGWHRRRGGGAVVQRCGMRHASTLRAVSDTTTAVRPAASEHPRT